MFSAAIITPDRSWRQNVHQLAVQSGQILVSRILDRFPYPYELVQMMNVVSPEVVFLDVQDPEEAGACAKSIQSEYPKTVLIGFRGEREAAIAARDHGIRFFLPSEADLAGFTEIVDQAIHEARGGIQANLLAFLPAKAGSGSSTVVLHTACALANQLKKKVLVIEADLRSGSLSILLNVAQEWSIQDMLQPAAELDKFKLAQCITSKHGVDLMLSNNAWQGPLPSWHQYFKLLEAVWDKYDWVLVDLPELVNPATAEVVRRAHLVFSVCTPEIPALKLAERRCRELEEKGVPFERIKIIVNRWHKAEIGQNDIERFLKLPVFALIPNNYRAVRTCLVHGQCLAKDTDVAGAFVEFASKLTGAQPPAPKLGTVVADALAGLFRRK